MEASVCVVGLIAEAVAVAVVAAVLVVVIAGVDVVVVVLVAEAVVAVAASIRRNLVASLYDPCNVAPAPVLSLTLALSLASEESWGGSNDAGAGVGAIPWFCLGILILGCCTGV